MPVDFAAALAAVERMKREGILAEYAIGGAMALVFWTEPVATFDLDVFVLLPGDATLLVSLEPLYQWAIANGYSAEGEHIVIEGIPVQFIPSHSALADEAIEESATLDYDGAPVRVIRPEHLIALYLEPSETPNRPRPSPELLERLREDKRRLHSAARALSPAEKVRNVIELQRIVLPQIARRRPLKSHEVVWPISRPL